MRVVIRNKAYQLQFTPKIEQGAKGMCDAPTAAGKRIRILERLKGQDRLETIIHELLHACYWDMDEEAIHHPAADIARVLWRLGYRAEK
jgi:hypothetical protein